MAELPGLVFSVSHTTRSPRAGEQDGRDYHFVDKAQFLTIADRTPSGFLEWAKVHGNLYGTSRRDVESRLAKGFDVVLDIDVQGAALVRDSADPVSVFIAPPSLSELARRLRGRGTETEESLRVRLANAEKEMADADAYTYVIVNDTLDDAAEALKAVIIAERCRRRRGIDGLPVQVTG